MIRELIEFAHDEGVERVASREFAVRCRPVIAGEFLAPLRRRARSASISAGATIRRHCMPTLARLFVLNCAWLVLFGFATCNGRAALAQDTAQPIEASAPAPAKPGANSTGSPPPASSGSPPSGTAATGAATDSAKPPITAPLHDLPAEIIYLPDGLGRLVPVPSDASLEAYLKSLKQDRRRVPEAPPGVSIASIELTGTATDDRAVLKAKLVALVSSEAPVRLALGFKEAVLREQPVHRGPGEFRPGGVDPEQGMRWWLEGKGSHEIDFVLSVPIRAQGGAKRLVLTAPQAAVSQLTLKTPYANLIAKGMEQSVVTIKKNERDAATDIEISGLGQRIDLTWQPQTKTEVGSEATQGAIEASSLLSAEFSAAGILVEGTQQIWAQQGTFDRVRVRLPTNGELESVPSGDVREFRVDPESKNRVTVIFREPTTGPVTIPWRVRLPLSNPRKATLDGFRIEGARRQIGEIGLIVEDGLSLTPSDVQDRSVVRMNAGELRLSAAGRQIKRAYRFLNQPFHLDVSLEPVDPYYTVDPWSILAISSDQTWLQTTIRGRVHRGQLEELLLTFPDRARDGWVLEDVEPRSQVEASFAATNAAGGELLRLVFAQPQRADFSVTLRARRSRKSGSENAVDWSVPLPHVNAEGSSRARLTVATSDNVSAALKEAMSAAWAPRAAEGVEADELPHAWKHWTRQDYRSLQATAPIVAVHVESRTPLLTANQELTIDWTASRWNILQRIRYVAEYQRTASVRIQVPQAVIGRIRWTDERGDELTAVYSPADGSAVRVATIAIKEPSASLSVMARYAWSMTNGTAGAGSTPGSNSSTTSGSSAGSGTGPSKDGRSGKESAASPSRDVSWPVLKPIDVVDGGMRIEIRRTGWTSWEPRGDGWQRIERTDGFDVWRSDRAAEQLTVSPASPSLAESPSTAIRKCWLQAAVDDRGRTVCRAQFRLERAPGIVSWTLPPATNVLGVAWNDSPLETDDIVEFPAASGRWSSRLRSYDEDDADGLLTIDFVPPATRDTAWNAGTQFAPTPVLLESSSPTQTVISLYLPTGRHLFWHSPGATPLYRWERQGLMFRRLSRPNSESAGDWIRAEDGPPRSFTTSSTNEYSFSQIGQSDGIRCLALSGSMIVIWGAGVALAMGFVALRVPSARHPLTLLSLAFSFSVCGLWFSESLLVLLQPFCAGLLAPLAMIAADWRRPRDLAEVLTLATPSDFLPPNPGPARNSSIVAPVEETTAYRPLGADERGGARAETESGVR